jgi:putative endopeptidase
VHAILANVVEAYRESIRDAQWLSAPARRIALQKLSLMTRGVGAPASWRNYSGLEINADDLFGNWQRGVAFEDRQHLANAAAGEYWTLPPQTVNAFYRPSTNQIVLPAAVLQPPIFDVDADDAVNYGAAGSLMAHEIAHAFDDRGRRFDAHGEVRNWWTPADTARFDETAERLAAQLDACEPLPGAHVNGRLAAAETLADLSGLAIAVRAYHLSLKGTAAPVIDGLTGDQRFFMGWAQMWRAVERDDYVRSTLQTAIHLPPALRANVAASNSDAFYEAFGVTPDRRLYRAPGARVRVW